MNDLLIIFSVIILLASAFIVIIGVNSSRPTWIKVITLIVGLSLAPFSFYTYNKMSGIPRVLLSTQSFKGSGVKIITYYIVKGKYIYLLVKKPEVDKPIYYELIWSKDFEEQLTDAFITSTTVYLRGGDTEEGQLVIHTDASNDQKLNLKPEPID